MTKFIWISDLHFSHDRSVLGFDATRHVEAVVSHIRASHTDAEFCLISGDLADRGQSAEYEALRCILDDLKMPVLPLTGNHDRRVPLRQVFELPENTMPEFVQYEYQLDEWCLLCLDTLVEGEGWGMLCPERLQWLQHRLESNTDRQTMVAMHHPPLGVGIPVLDPDNLRNGHELLELLSGYSNVRHILCGHVHRLVQGLAGGIPFATMRSVLFQAPQPNPAWDWDTFAPSGDALGLGVVLLSSNGLIIQNEEFSVEQAQTVQQPVS